ncbi:hypothetical protein VJ923_11840 [Adlercreutzia sp. R25]|uniref:DUF559 domain-containing protein n=1 Tax=Adlercreutzia shanghongiae TaxID=3111773 RepID=A0ABU6IZJ3_9ACTN|nr:MULTISPECIES: hypothetical protein [unclassified Adlercreutzia]MEC4273849.1 hypothetical protein [Adlercreutzia sp. R25]MEC4295301.1 hypothetical protein [Adlercreutzia sp. R22]
MANPISLQEFHARRINQVDGLPARLFAGSSVLTSPASSKNEIEEALGRALDPGELPLHVLIRRSPGTRQTKAIARHHGMATYPKGAFLKMGRHLFVSAPELVFCQLAQHLPFGSLLALGYELCGCYPIEGSGYQVRHPLTTPNRLAAFAQQLRGAHGAVKARKAARCVRAKSASPAETSMAALLTTPRALGGLGLSQARLNDPVSLNADAERIAQASALVCDIVWPDDKVAFEYDSAAYHGTGERVVKDSRRRSALAANGYVVRSITSGQMANVFEFQETVVHAFRESGTYLRRMNAKQLEVHMRLRSELKKGL